MRWRGAWGGGYRWDKHRGAWVLVGRSGLWGTPTTATGVVLAWTGSEARGWHDGIHARHNVQSGELSAKPDAEAWAWISAGTAGCHCVAVLRGGARLGSRPL